METFEEQRGNMDYKRKQSPEKEALLADLERGLESTLDKIWGETKGKIIDDFMKDVREWREIKSIE